MILFLSEITENHSCSVVAKFSNNMKPLKSVGVPLKINRKDVPDLITQVSSEIFFNLKRRFGTGAAQNIEKKNPNKALVTFKTDS